MRDPRHALALILLTVATTAVPAADPPTTADAIPDRAVARLGVVRPRWNYATAHAFPSPGVLVTADDALTVCHWDLATGRIIRQQQFPCADTAWPRLSANGKFLAARDWGGASIRLINLETGEQMRSLTLPDIDSLWEFDISADGRFVAGIAHNKKALSAHLWVSATGKAVPLHTGKGYVQPPHFSPDGGRVVAFVDDVPQCWNAAGGTLIWSGEAVKNVDPTAFCFTPDGKFVLARASASVGSPLWWDSETGKLVSPTVKVGPNQPPADSSGSALSSISFGPLPRLPLFSANGRTMTTVLDGQKLEARDGKTGKLRKEIANVYGVLGLSPDGRIGAGWIAGGTPQCWDLDSGQPIWPEIPDRAHAGTVNRVVFSPNGRLLISVAADDEARLWDVPSRAVRAKIPAAAASLAAFTPDGLAAILATPSEWMVLDTATTQVKRQQSWPNDSKETSHGVVEIAISPDSKSMVTLIDMEGKELKVEKWDLSSGKLLSQQSLNSGRAFAAGQWVAPVRRAEAHLQDQGHPRGFLLGGRRLFAIDGQIHDTQTGNAIVTVTPPPDTTPHYWKGAVKAAQSAAIAVCASEGERAPEELAPFAQTDTRVTPSGPSLWVIDTEIGRVLQSIRPDKPGRFEVSPNGRWSAMMEPQGFAIWETGSGKRVLSFAQAGVRSLAFAPDSKTIATGLANGTIVIWDLSPEKLDLNIKLSAAELREAWSRLTGSEGDRAYEALWRLTAAKADAVPFLSAQLKTIAPVSDEHIQRLIADLDASRYAARETASRELADLGDRAIPALRAARGGPLSVEAQRRVDRLLNRRFIPIPSETIRFLRAVEVLERIGTPQAQQALVALSAGDSRVLETRAVREALERMARRE